MNTVWISSTSVGRVRKRFGKIVGRRHTDIVEPTPGEGAERVSSGARVGRRNPVTTATGDERPMIACSKRYFLPLVGNGTLDNAVTFPFDFWLLTAVQSVPAGIA